MRKYTTAVMSGMLAFFVVFGSAGCASDDVDADVVAGDATDVAAPETEAPETEAPATERTGDPGSATNPLPLGTVAKLGDWEVTITSVTKNANDDIAEANALNDPPIDGSQFVLSTVEAKYVGTGEGVFWSDVAYRFSGVDGDTFDSGMAESPNSLYEAPNPKPGESISGDMALQVPVGQIEGGAIVLWDASSLDDTEELWDIQ